MFKNFLIISIRNLLRNKIFSAVNIFGLAVGMAPCMYFLGKYWLGNFAFRIEIGWMVFIIPVLILLGITLLTTSVQIIKSSLINPAYTIKHE